MRSVRNSPAAARGPVCVLGQGCVARPQPPVVNDCDGLKGACFGLCNAFCNAIKCQASDQVNQKPCDRVLQNYSDPKHGCPPMPCLQPPEPTCPPPPCGSGEIACAAPSYDSQDSNGCQDVVCCDERTEHCGGWEGCKPNCPATTCADGEAPCATSSSYTFDPLRDISCPVLDCCDDSEQCVDGEGCVGGDFTPEYGPYYAEDGCQAYCSDFCARNDKCVRQYGCEGGCSCRECDESCEPTGLKLDRVVCGRHSWDINGQLISYYPRCLTKSEADAEEVVYRTDYGPQFDLSFDWREGECSPDANGEATFNTVFMSGSYVEEFNVFGVDLRMCFASCYLTETGVLAGDCGAVAERLCDERGGWVLGTTYYYAWTHCAPCDNALLVNPECVPPPEF